jgi:thiol-disulfide isomerase/thioredoxin
MLWKLRAENDLSAGRNEAALADYARSIEKNPDDSEALKSARELYMRIHGSDAGYETWQQNAQRVAQAASEEVTEAVRRPLPDVNLPDLAGKRWTSADLHGKAVLLNFWATWCGPCRSELPHIQRLFEVSKNRRDIAVVTVSVDDKPGIVEPYLKERKLTFPVLIAGPGSIRRWAPDGIPLTYVVDPKGTIVQEQTGFGGKGDLWIAKMEGYLAAALVAEKK